MRSVAVGYILWALFGVLGIHRFYCGRILTGVLWFFTAGLLGIGWLVDMFLIPSMVREANLREPPLFGPPAVGGGYGVQAAYCGSPAVAAAYRVIYCTHCGGPMQVPAGAAGRQYACPSCRTVLEVPG